jgi:hypothetical protein
LAKEFLVATLRDSPGRPTTGHAPDRGANYSFRYGYPGMKFSIKIPGQSGVQAAQGDSVIGVVKRQFATDCV